MDFIGVKGALVYEGMLVVIQRDNKPGLRFAGLWDFPGGGREGNETPFECLNREVFEELHMHLKKSAVVWETTHPAMYDPSLLAYFIVIPITKADVDSIVFGDEGQGWKLMDVDEFMDSKEVVPDLKGRLQPYLDSGQHLL